jgi:hypothetical protein
MATTEINGELTTIPAWTDGTYCRRDRDKTWRTLTSLPELWVRLHMELGRKGQGGERVSGSRTAPIPLNVSVDALLREQRDILLSWDERVREAAGLKLPDTQAACRRRDHGRQVTAAAATLAAHLETLLALPPGPVTRSYPLHDTGRIPEGAYGRTVLDGGYCEVVIDLDGARAGEEILRLGRRDRAMLGETRMRELLIGVPCPSPACEMLMLERVHGSNYAAECGACGRLLTADEYMAWVRLYASSIGRKDIERITASRAA